MNQIAMANENALTVHAESYLSPKVYARHFGFAKLPFSNLPNRQFFYSHKTANNVINTVLFSLKTGESLVKITGESGTGKSFLISQILSSLRPEFYCIQLSGATIKPDTVLKTIIEELGQAYPADASITQLAKYARYLLFDHYAKSDCKLVIWIDDAEKLSIDCWNMIEFLLNMHTSERSLLQFVVSGLPEVDLTLDLPELVKLKNRVAFSDELKCMSLHDTQAYLAARFNLVCDDEAQSITPHAIKILHQKTKGNPLEINKLAHKAFMLAFGRGDEEVSHNHILSAFNQRPVRVLKGSVVGLIIMVPLLLALGAAASIYFMR